jgi:2-dehydropantoate 2-reductase
MGAGAVGSAFGAFLKKDGHAVTLAGRRDHLDAIREKGLLISGIWGEHRVTGFTLVTDVSAVHDVFDAIFICVKSYDTESAATAIKPLLTQETLLLSLQNGLGNLETIRKTAGHRLILGGRVIFGILSEGPGKIKITAYTEPVMIGFPADTLSGLSPEAKDKAKTLALAINSAAIPCLYTEEIEKYLWSKMLYNCALNPLGAIHRVHYGALMENPEWKTFVEGILREIFIVARAKRVDLFWKTPEEFLALFYGKLIPDTYNHRSSMLQDIEKGKRTEIDNMNGMIVRYGEETNTPTPLNRTMVEKLHSLSPGNIIQPIPD